MSDMNDMREAFEREYAKLHDGFCPSMYDGEYDWADAQNCWLMFQAGCRHSQQAQGEAGDMHEAYDRHVAAVEHEEGGGIFSETCFKAGWKSAIRRQDQQAQWEPDSEAFTLLMRDITEQFPCDPDHERAVCVDYDWLYDRIKEAFRSASPAEVPEWRIPKGTLPYEAIERMEKLTPAMSYNDGPLKGLIRELWHCVYQQNKCAAPTPAEQDHISRDAARYRWLRSRPLDAIQRGGVFAGQTPENIVLNGDDLDQYIDQSMAGDPMDEQETKGTR